MKLVDLVGLSLEATVGAPVVLLRERDAPHRLLPLFMGAAEALPIALALSGEAPPRPLTHDVMAALVQSLDAHVDRVEVTEVRDGSFLAELAVSGPGGGRRVDSRPSDAIALAVRLDAPLFVSDRVLDEAGSVMPDEDAVDQDDVDQVAIDEEVARFRLLLDDLDPTASTGKVTGPAGPPGTGRDGADGLGSPSPVEGPTADDPSGSDSDPDRGDPAT